MFLTIALADEVGTGSLFTATLANKKLDLFVYITKVENKALFVEFHYSDSKGYKTWQHYHLKKLDEKLSLVKVLLKESLESEARLIEKGKLEINKGEGFPLYEFLFRSPKSIEKNLIGYEVVQLAAGTVNARRYRKRKNGQIIDFWINDQVKPITLVKLVSRGTKSTSQNYSLELKSLIKNVSAQIDPDRLK